MAILMAILMVMLGKSWKFLVYRLSSELLVWEEQLVLQFLVEQYDRRQWQSSCLNQIQLIAEPRQMIEVQ